MSRDRYDRNGSARTSNAWSTTRTQNRRNNGRYDDKRFESSRDGGYMRDAGGSGYMSNRDARDGGYSRFGGSRDRMYSRDRGSRYDRTRGYKHSRGDGAPRSYRGDQFSRSNGGEYAQDNLRSGFHSMNLKSDKLKGRHLAKDNSSDVEMKKQNPKAAGGAYVPPHLRARRQQPQTKRPPSDSGTSRSFARMPAAPASSAPALASPSKSRWVEHPRHAGPTGVNDCCLFFGDSFVGCFTLLPSKHNFVLKKFKGATAKGLTRATNENRQTVLSTVKRLYEKRACRPVNQAVFVFGNVDVHMSYYYCRYHKKKAIDFEEIACAYVSFVASVPHTQHKTVVGVFPSSWQAKHVRHALAVYRAILDEDKALIPDGDCLLSERQKRVLQFNRVLKRECAKHPSITYVDVYQELVDPATQQVRPRFLDESLYNVHFIWETTLLLWLDKFKWLEHHLPKTFREGLMKSLDTYRRSKGEELKEKAAERAAERESVKQLLKSAREGMLTREMFEDLGIETDTWSDDDFRDIQQTVALESGLRTAAMLQACVNTVVPPIEGADEPMPDRD